MIPVTASIIGKLLGRPRMWAYRQIRAGRFGPIVHRHGLWTYVDLVRVQAAEHQPSRPLLALSGQNDRTPLSAVGPKRTKADFGLRRFVR
jgi:hypothetical protein